MNNYRLINNKLGVCQLWDSWLSVEGQLSHS